MTANQVDTNGLQSFGVHALMVCCLSVRVFALCVVRVFVADRVPPLRTRACGGQGARQPLLRSGRARDQQDQVSQVRHRGGHHHIKDR